MHVVWSLQPGPDMQSLEEHLTIARALVGGDLHNSLAFKEHRARSRFFTKAGSGGAPRMQSHRLSIASRVQPKGANRPVIVCRVMQVTRLRQAALCRRFFAGSARLSKAVKSKEF